MQMCLMSFSIFTPLLTSSSPPQYSLLLSPLPFSSSHFPPLSSPLHHCLILSPPETCPPAGVMQCMEGKRGPWRQTTQAALQNRQLDPQKDLQEPGGSSRGVVRGTLPQVLRGLDGGQMSSFHNNKKL